MTRSRNLGRDFSMLLGHDEPQLGCAAFAEYMELETKHREVMAETILEIVLDPLDWYMQVLWEEYGAPTDWRSCPLRVFRLAADDIRYRFANKQMICIEQIEELERKWVAFQAYVGCDTLRRMDKAMPDIRRGRKIKTSASLGHAEVHGTPEEKAARWGKYLRDCIDVERTNPRLGMTAIRQTVAEMNGVSIKTVARHTKNLADILKNA